MAKNRSRRLRKKLYSDEFTVYAFSATCTLSIAQSSDYYDMFIEKLIDFVESRKLMIAAGGSNNKFDCFVMADGRYDSATEEDRLAIEKWLVDSGKCTDIEVSALFDANADEQ